MLVGEYWEKNTLGLMDLEAYEDEGFITRIDIEGNITITRADCIPWDGPYGGTTMFKMSFFKKYYQKKLDRVLVPIEVVAMAGVLFAQDDYSPHIWSRILDASSSNQT